MFYNTGIITYIWIVCNRKPAARKGKVQLIDADLKRTTNRILAPLQDDEGWAFRGARSLFSHHQPRPVRCVAW